MATRPTTPSAQFTALLSRFPPGIVASAKRCITKLRRAFPGSYQLVYEYATSIVVGFGESERGYESVVALAIHPTRLQLYFDKSVPDPHRRLEGSGSKVRSVTLNSAADFDEADVQALIKAALKHSGAKFSKDSPIRIVIKSTAAQKKPKKAARTG